MTSDQNSKCYQRNDIKNTRNEWNRYFWQRCSSVFPNAHHVDGCLFYDMSDQACLREFLSYSIVCVCLEK